MRLLPPSIRLVCLLTATVLSAACGGTASVKPFEVLDESSGMTIGTLDEPLELVQQGAAMAPAGTERRVSFAYLGPVEWDNMGTITYGLWVHVAPGNDWRFADIQAPGAVRLELEDSSTALAAFKPPSSSRAPYRAVASWGVTAYFLVDLPTLRRMAASARIGLDIQSVNGSVVHFIASPSAPQILTRFLHSRGY